VNANTPVGLCHTNNNAVIVVDLAKDPQPLFDLDADALHERLYTRHDELGDLLPVPVKLVHLNKCPILAPAKTLTAENAKLSPYSPAPRSARKVGAAVLN